MHNAVFRVTSSGCIKLYVNLCDELWLLYIIIDIGISNPVLQGDQAKQS